MPSIAQRAAENIARLAGVELVRAASSQKQPLPKTQPPYAHAIHVQGLQIGEPKRGAALLRRFSVNNEWVRAAINRRKNALAYADYRIVRIDDPKKPPDPKVVSAVTDLFKFCNAERESFSTLLKKIVEDVLVLDAGCVEKVYRMDSQLAGLYAVDGASIKVDPEWELTCNPKAPRYYQYAGYEQVASLLNQQLIYIMHNPRTNSPVGWSPVETLVRVIEAELYTETYDFDAMKQNIPEIAFDLGPGVHQNDLESFRTYYETEIAGTRSVMILGGYGDDAGVPGDGVKAIELKRSGQMVDREAYKKYLATKIAAVFEIDLVALGLIENVNRSTSKTGQEQSDRGLVGLARTVQEYVTREIIWDFDENHGFEFDGIVPNDEMSEAKIWQIYAGIGVMTPNEMRAELGMDPVEWGDFPYTFNSTQTPDPLDPDAPTDDAENGSDAASGDGDDDEPPAAQKPKPGGSKAANPFGARRALHRLIGSAKTDSQSNSAI